MEAGPESGVFRSYPQQARQDAAAARQASLAAGEVYRMHQRLTESTAQQRSPQATHPAQLAAAAQPDPAQEPRRNPATSPHRGAAGRPPRPSPGHDDDRGRGR